MISVRLSSNFESFKPFYVVPFAFLLFVVGHFCRTRLKCSDGLPRQNNIQDGRNKTHNIIFRMFEKILDSKNTSTLMHDHLSCQNCRVQSHCVCMRRHLIFKKKKNYRIHTVFFIVFYFIFVQQAPLRSFRQNFVVVCVMAIEKFYSILFYLSC